MAEHGFGLESHEMILRKEPSIRSVTAPPAAAIGYIPQVTLDLLQEQSAFRKHRFSQERYHLTSPFKALFAVGNPTPEDVSNPSEHNLQDLGQTLRFADTRNFRALVIIDSVRVSVSDRGEVTRVAFEVLRKVGYTRVPLFQAGPFDPYVHFEPGTEKERGSTWFQVSEANGVVCLSIWLRYRIGDRGDRIGQLLSGKRAPYPLVRIDYVFKPHGLASIRFLGSNIPSLSMYVNWQRVSKHDMLGLDEARIEEFFDAEQADAPDEPLGTWTP